MKSAESCPNRAAQVREHVVILRGAEESGPEVGCAAYMPGVYKISMVRMFYRGLTNLRMYGSIEGLHRNVQGRLFVVSVVE